MAGGREWRGGKEIECKTDRLPVRGYHIQLKRNDLVRGLLLQLVECGDFGCQSRGQRYGDELGCELYYECICCIRYFAWVDDGCGWCRWSGSFGDKLVVVKQAQMRDRVRL